MYVCVYVSPKEGVVYVFVRGAGGHSAKVELRFGGNAWTDLRLMKVFSTAIERR